MRLELGHRESVNQQCLALFEQIENVVRARELGRVLEGCQTARTACSGLHELEELTGALAAFEAMIARLIDGGAAHDEKTAAVISQAVNTFKHALVQLGTGSKASARLPRVLQELTKVMGQIPRPAKQLKSVTPPSQDNQVIAAAEKGMNSAIAGFREAFLGDEAGTFGEIATLGERLALEKENALRDGKTVVELFRLFHTAKGNAMALGLNSTARFTHAVEDLLHLVFLAQFPQDLETAGFLVDCIRILLDASKVCLRTGVEPQALDQSAKHVRAFIERRNAQAELEQSLEKKPPCEIELPRSPAAALIEQVPEKRTNPEPSLYFLAVKVGGREAMIPCDCVAEVLLRPQVLAVPGGRKGWLGVIRAAGGLVPLVESQSVVATESDGTKPAAPSSWEVSWVVVLSARKEVEASSESQESPEPSYFSVPVDEVGKVLEFQHGFNDKTALNGKNATVLDVPSMLKKIGVK